MPRQGPKASELFGKTAAGDRVGNDLEEKYMNMESHLDSQSGIGKGANATKDIQSNPCSNPIVV